MSTDVHAHFWTDAYLDKIAALGKTDTAAQRGRGAGGGADLDARLALMDRAEVGMQILSAAPQLPHGPDETAAVDAARFVNDQYAELVARHPGRFAAFGSLPLPHIDASLAELARALDDLRMAGVALTTTIMDQPLIDSPAAQLFAELDRRGTVLFLHPAGNAAWVLLTERAAVLSARCADCATQAGVPEAVSSAATTAATIAEQFAGHLPQDLRPA